MLPDLSCQARPENMKLFFHQIKTYTKVIYRDFTSSFSLPTLIQSSRSSSKDIATYQSLISRVECFSQHLSIIPFLQVTIAYRQSSWNQYHKRVQTPWDSFFSAIMPEIEHFYFSFHSLPCFLPPPSYETYSPLPKSPLLSSSPNKELRSADATT